MSTVQGQSDRTAMILLVGAKQRAKRETRASCLIPRGNGLFVDIVSDAGKGTRLHGLRAGIKQMWRLKFGLIEATMFSKQSHASIA